MKFFVKSSIDITGTSNVYFRDKLRVLTSASLKEIMCLIIKYRLQWIKI